MFIFPNTIKNIYKYFQEGHLASRFIMRHSIRFTIFQSMVISLVSTGPTTISWTYLGVFDKDSLPTRWSLAGWAQHTLPTSLSPTLLQVPSCGDIGFTLWVCCKSIVPTSPIVLRVSFKVYSSWPWLRFRGRWGDLLALLAVRHLLESNRREGVMGY